MSNLYRGLFLAFALIALSACNKGEDKKPAEAAPVVLTAPTDGTDQSWKQYIAALVKQNMKGVRSQPFLYYLPVGTTPDFEDQYNRQLDNVAATIARTVTPGNMLAFGSPESARMADLVIEAFKSADAGSFKDVKVLFIGKPEDGERVRAGVEASGAEYIFIEAK